jgi:glutamate-1-semialdehyde 2,1-aminomutase
LAAAESRYARSERQYERAQKSLATGVATAMRAAQRPVPLALDHGRGSRVVDLDGNEYVDHVLGFGPLLLGHCPPAVTAAVHAQLDRGSTFGAQHELEAELAERLVEVIPCAELCCFSTTGSEAVHTALRIARAGTGRRKVVKFQGHYHGWVDPVLVSTPGTPAAPAADPVPLDPVPATGGQLGADEVLVARWNDAAGLEALFAARGEEIAAVLMEPVACNGGLIEPLPGFLEKVRELTAASGALMIFDEVVTGFRMAVGGAQEVLGITPDLAVYGKAIAAGLPLSAVAGSEAAMAPLLDGRVAHVGTFNCNPLCAAAAIAAIDVYRGEPDFYARLDAHVATLAEGLASAADAAGVPLRVRRSGSLLQTAVGGPATPREYAETLGSDREAEARFSEEMLNRGVIVLPRNWWFSSAAHDEADLQLTLQAAAGALAAVAELDPQDRKVPADA